LTLDLDEKNLHPSFVLKWRRGARRVSRPKAELELEGGGKGEMPDSGPDKEGRL
jgi:hypothetical protein